MHRCIKLGIRIKSKKLIIISHSSLLITGKGINSYAQQLSNIAQAIVYAPTSHFGYGYFFIIQLTEKVLVNLNLS